MLVDAWGEGEWGTAGTIGGLPDYSQEVNGLEQHSCVNAAA